MKKQKIIDTPYKNKFNYMSGMTTLDTEAERRTVLSTVRKPELVYGSYAFNRQVKYPIYQKRPFTDIDIKAPNSKQEALDIERKLDKKVGMNNYYVSPLQHDEGMTYRVVSRFRNTVVADVSKPRGSTPTRTIDDVPYETLSHRKQEVSKILKKQSAEYRREKDMTMMGYIKRYENLKEYKKIKWR